MYIYFCNKLDVFLLAYWYFKCKVHYYKRATYLDLGIRFDLDLRATNSQNELNIQKQIFAATNTEILWKSLSNLFISKI